MKKFILLAFMIYVAAVAVAQPGYIKPGIIGWPTSTEQNLALQYDQGQGKTVWVPTSGPSNVYTQGDSICVIDLPDTICVAMDSIVVSPDSICVIQNGDTTCVGNAPGATTIYTGDGTVTGNRNIFIPSGQKLQFHLLEGQYTSHFNIRDNALNPFAFSNGYNAGNSPTLTLRGIAPQSNNYIRFESGAYNYLIGSHKTAGVFRITKSGIIDSAGAFVNFDGNYNRTVFKMPVRIDSTLMDGEGDVGTPGQVLQAVAGGINWADPAAPTAPNINDLLPADGTNTINNQNYLQQWDWNSLSSGSGLKLAANSTAAAGNTQSILEIALSGTNATSGQSTYAMRSVNSHGGSGAQNYAIHGTALGGVINTGIYGGATGGGGSALNSGVWGVLATPGFQDAAVRGYTPSEGYGVHGTSGTGVGGSVFDNVGVYGVAGTSGVVGVYGRSTIVGGIAVISEKETSTSNSVDVANLQIRQETTGTAGNGLGAALNYTIEASDGAVYDAASVIGKWSNATAGSRTSEVSITTRDSGIEKTGLTIEGNGKVRLNQYTAGNFSGTPAYNAQFDASGYLIATTASAGLQGGGDGGGTAFLSSGTGDTLRIVSAGSARVQAISGDSLEVYAPHGGWENTGDTSAISVSEAIHHTGPVHIGDDTYDGAAALNVVGAMEIRGPGTAGNNIGIGRSAMADVMTGSYGGTLNIGIGEQSLQDLTEGDHNVAIGHGAGVDVTTGNKNTMLGHDAGASVATTHDNVIAGYQSAFQNSAADQNVIIGSEAHYGAFDGDRNVIMGYRANYAPDFFSAPTGNVLLGAFSGYQAANKNVMIGDSAGYNWTGSDRLFIENGPSADPLIAGDFSEDTVRLNAALRIRDVPAGDAVGDSVLMWEKTSGRVRAVDPAVFWGGRATTALDNLASVAINADLLPGTSGAVELGSPSYAWGGLYLQDSTYLLWDNDNGFYGEAGTTYLVGPLSGDYYYSTNGDPYSAGWEDSDELARKGDIYDKIETLSGGSAVPYDKTITVDGSGDVLTSGIKGRTTIPASGTITGVTLLADASGSVVFDIKKCAFADFPGSLASIVGANDPELSSAQKAQITLDGGWTTTVTAGDVLEFSITGTPSTVTQVSLIITITP